MSFQMTSAVILLAAFVSGWAWWLRVMRPEKWNAMVDRDNDFWVKKGLISPALAERVKAAEKGLLMKWTLGFCAIFLAIGVVVNVGELVRLARMDNRRVKLPYNPALIIKPKQAVNATNLPPKDAKKPAGH